MTAFSGLCCYSLTLEGDSAAPGLLRDFVKKNLSDQGITGQIAEDLALAVYEAVANVVEHALDRAEGRGICLKMIVLKMTVERNGIEVLVSSNGVSFAGKSAAVNLEHLIEKKSSGGLGLALIRSLVDELEYYRHDGRNVTRLYIKG